jgi:hypothetical protein
MRALFAVIVLSLAASGCTPFIPVKDDFATSALTPVGDIPPEFAEFNAYNPGVNPLLAYQLCATPYEPLQDRRLGATPGQIVEARGRCQTHVPLLGN